MRTYSYLDICQITGCGLATIKRLANKLYQDKPITGKSREFTEEQAKEIIAKVPKKNLVSIDTTLISNDTSRISRLETMVEKLCGAVTNLTAAISRPQAPAIAPQPVISAPIQAPVLTARSELIMTINRYTQKDPSRNYSATWGQLYEQAYHRLHINFPLRARKEHIPTIEYIDRHGHLPAVLSIAKEIMI